MVRFAVSVPPVIFQAPLRPQTMAADELDVAVHGVVTVGGVQFEGSALFGFAVLNRSVPPVMFRAPSVTTLPPENVMFVPFPIENVGQSIHQLPDTVIVPDGLQPRELDQREYVGPGEPVVPTALARRSTYAGAPLVHPAIATPWNAG